MSVYSSSLRKWDHGQEGKDLELSSEVFLVSPAPHDLIGSDIRETTVPLQHRDPSRHGIRPTGTLAASCRFGTTKNYLLGLTEASRAIWLHSLAQLHSLTALSAMSDRLSSELGTTRRALWYNTSVTVGAAVKTLFCLPRRLQASFYLSLPGCTDPGLMEKTNKKRKQRSDRSFTRSK